MRLLYVAEFDPCCVGIRWKKHLAQHGIELRLAVRDVYWEEGTKADWILQGPREPDYYSLTHYAGGCDAIIFNPCIGWPWSSFHKGYIRDWQDGERCSFGSVSWNFSFNTKKIALFHGSHLLASCPGAYAKRYRELGYKIAATTLDYVDSMGAEYLPPVVDLVDHAVAPHRTVVEPLKIIHSPSDPKVCQTDEFMSLVRNLGMSATINCGTDHRACLNNKIKHHLGFDHLRGSFSINSVENAALGLVNLVGVKQKYRDYLFNRLGVELPWPRVETMTDVARWLMTLQHDAGKTAHWQQRGREWYLKEWTPEKTSARVAEAITRMVKE